MDLIIAAVFVFCAAMAAGSILLVTRMMGEGKGSFLRPLFYYAIFMSAFGFYGVWGQFLIVSVAGNQLTPEILSSVSVISLLLGLPFLVFGWLMLVHFAAECTGKGLKNISTALIIAGNFAAIFIIGFAVRDQSFADALPLIKYYYAAASLLFSVVASALILRNNQCSFRDVDRRIVSVIITAGALAQGAVLLFMTHSIWMALVFVFLLFGASALLVTYLNYGAEMKKPSQAAPDVKAGDMKEIMKLYDISPREEEIIREICGGLSNQEIADRLFISLQTVKDHTSRIYSKMNVKSRTQLMTRLRETGAL